MDPAPPSRQSVRSLGRRCYSRVLDVGEHCLLVEVTQTEPGGPLEVSATGEGVSAACRAPVATALGRLLGLDRDLSGFYALAAGDPQLSAVAEPFRGMKPPRFLSLFETLVNAVACQQVSLALGINLLNRLCEAYGQAVSDGDEKRRAFPRPQNLAEVTPEELRALGFSTQKGRTLVELARAATAGQLDEAELEALDDETVVARVRGLRGIGRWSAEYLLLRGLGRLNVFPGDDVGARTRLEAWLGVPEALDYAGVARVVERWQPYAGLIYFHLLLRRLREAGHV